MKLSEIPYQRPNMETIGQTIQNLCIQFQDAETATLQLDITHQINDLQLEFNTQATLATLHNDLNSFDEFYEKEVAFWNQQYPIFRNLINNYYKVLSNSRFRAELEQQMGSRLFHLTGLWIEESNQKTESIDQKINELEGEYMKMASQGTFSFQGETHPLRSISKFNQSQNEIIRKAAYDSLYDFWESKEKELHDSFDKLVQLRHKRAQTVGFENYIENNYHDSDYNGTQVSTFNKAVLKYIVPIMSHLYERKLERMGVEQTYYYDTISYKNGNPKLQVSSGEFWSNIQKMYTKLSPETDEFCQFMLENELLDTEIRKGKLPISYMTYLQKYGQPFIFANFEGTWKDCSLTIHEMGHAFQYYQTHKEGIRQIEYMSTHNTIAEIHAMGMELLTWDSYSLFFKEDIAKFQFDRISGFLGTIVYCCMSEDFQQFIYKNPCATPLERNQKWLELQKIYYPYRTDSYSKNNVYLQAGHEWQENPQIFCYPFYAVEYSLATLCALQFWRKAQNNKEEAWNDYLQLCRIGGKYSYFESLQLANLRSPFEEEVIKEIAVFLSDWLEGVDDSGF